MRLFPLSLLVAVLVAFLATYGHAAGFRRRSTTTSTTVCQGGSCSTTAETHATEIARTGILRHAASAHRREVLGFSSSSPQDALDRCCFSGQYPEVEASVVRGRGGWYAVKRYSH